MKNERDIENRIYGFLAEDEDARVCREIPAAACNEQPRSFLLQLGALTLTRLADALASPRLVLAWMLSALGAPAVFIGLLVPLRESLALLPQLLVAQFLREQAVRKRFWVAGALGQVLAFMAMVLAVLFLRGVSLGVAVIAALVFLSLARGVCSVTAKDVLGKTVSRTRRGRLTGSAASAAGAITLMVAAVLLLAPGTDGSAMLFAVLLGLAGALWALAAMLYAAIPEVPGATAGGGNAITEAARSIGLLRTDPHFAHFVRARALLVSGAFAIPYLVVLIQRTGEGNGAMLGTLMLASGLAGMLAGAAWGRFADHGAHRAMSAAALISVFVMLAAVLVHGFFPAWLHDQFVAGGLLFAASVAHHGARVARKTYLVDMANEENRSQYVAVSNSVIGVVLLLGVLLGWLDHLVGAESVLLLLVVPGVLAVFDTRRLPNVSKR